MSERKLISILCPVHNEQATVPLFYPRLKAALQPLESRYDYELIFTNNRSSDNTLAEIQKIRATDPRVQVLTLSRNFGYECSVATGLRHARGAAIAVIDVDCEDPPEMISQFVAEWEAGNDIVYGKRDRRQEPLLMHLTRKLYYRLNKIAADSDAVVDMAEFFLITAPVRDAILISKSTVPFFRTEVAYVGFQRKGIPYERQKRIAGETHYNLWRLTGFAIRGMLSSSTFPLRLSVYAFGPLAIANGLLLWTDRFKELVALDFLYVAFFLAVICIYLARTYKDVVGRPISVVDWRQSHYNGPRP
jgi:dolichol-phosphate mannosyltransferase